MVPQRAQPGDIMAIRRWAGKGAPAAASSRERPWCPAPVGKGAATRGGGRDKGGGGRPPPFAPGARLFFAVYVCAFFPGSACISNEKNKRIGFPVSLN
jgi:hypothetical protein